MKYYIEFELPDNDVVLEGIEHEWVKWGVWGYSGYAYAKPVAYEKPDLSTMLFSERKELADKYEQWAKKNCVKDCALSVISYLCAFGYIPTLFNRERKHGQWIPVSEKLPDKEGWYLVTDDSGGVLWLEVEHYDPESGLEPLCTIQNPVAWMSLPEPYWEDESE